MSKEYYVHPSSYIDEPVQIGKGSVIMHFCHIMPHTIIGQNCRINRNVTIESGVIIGNNVLIENNVTIKSGVILEDNVICGQSIVFAQTPTLHVRDIKPKTSKMNPTIVKIGANIGPNSTIICGNNLGIYSLIGAGSVIIRSVPNYAFV
jgi:UDP-2-acetamido-3-amino-2,3-dideoxy-glucuronate N-acetyltransferase